MLKGCSADDSTAVGGSRGKSRVFKRWWAVTEKRQEDVGHMTVKMAAGEGDRTGSREKR